MKKKWTDMKIDEQFLVATKTGEQWKIKRCEKPRIRMSPSIGVTEIILCGKETYLFGINNPETVMDYFFKDEEQWYVTTLEHDSKTNLRNLANLQYVIDTEKTNIFHILIIYK